jgi:endoglucanase
MKPQNIGVFRALLVAMCLLPVIGNANPVSLTSGFYVNPGSQAKNWVARNPSDSRMPVIRDRIANQATGAWFVGGGTTIGTSVRNYVTAAQTAKRLPVLVAYNIPGRDCGSYSAGGAYGGDAYKVWISSFAAAIGTKPAIVILEPDALTQLDCLPTAADRSLLNYAVDQFATKAPNTWVYIDAGHSAWLSASETATRLINAGVRRARGFVINVSNYRTTAELTTFGKAVASQLQTKGGFTRPFAIDTSRNGNGPGSTWCDPKGRKIGVTSRVHASGSQPEMSLWVKAPGEADGCAASAGTFVPDLAYKLALGL